MSHKRDGELEGCMTIGCETPLKFKGSKKVKGYGQTDHWYCPEHEETVRIDEEGEIIE